VSAPTPAELVADFHRAFGHPIAEVPAVPPVGVVNLRLRLIREEIAELREACFREDRTAVAAEAADVVYVSYGAALTWTPMDEPFPVGIPWAARDPWTWLTSENHALGWSEQLRTADPHWAACVAFEIAHAAYQVADQHGVTREMLDEVIAVVHAANMAKRLPDGTVLYDGEGKVQKPVGWQPADISAVLARFDAESRKAS
jgi:predicted HAD superfamily Cof-like phosphohydrolase